MSNYLKSVRIQRFRSITDQKIDLAPITVFVGANDSGKSNILKAINLFFNNEVVPDSDYEHERDFSKIAPKRQRKAEEVQIAATIESPHSRHKGQTVWIRRWRYDGLLPGDSIRRTSKLPEKSKFGVWLTRLNYRYVPANKGYGYMRNLMRELYDLLATTVDVRIRAGAENFISEIREQTSQISEEIKEVLDLDSRIQLPEDLSSLFELFDFETDGKISLNQRGDGILARHIPAILGYLADRKNQAKGTVRGNTIWGYEEPENNIEMGAAFKQAQKFVEYAKHIQILMTTHSPAFYGLVGREGVKVYHVWNEGGQAGGDTRVKEIGHPQDADQKMGVMPIVAPYIREIADELEAVKEKYRNSLPWNIPILFVEGGFDERIINFCVAKMFSGKKAKFAVCAVQGADKMPYALAAAKALTKTAHPVKCLGLFDNDEAGAKAKKRCSDFGVLSNKPTVKRKVLTVSIPRVFRDTSVNSAFCLEHLFPGNYWEEARDRGYLQDHDEVYVRVKEADLFSSSNRDIRLSYKVRRESKTAFAEIAMQRMEKDGIPEDLREQVARLIKELEV